MTLAAKNHHFLIPTRNQHTRVRCFRFLALLPTNSQCNILKRNTLSKLLLCFEQPKQLEGDGDIHGVPKIIKAFTNSCPDFHEQNARSSER
jgi:hypothetical protein